MGRKRRFQGVSKPEELKREERGLERGYLRLTWEAQVSENDQNHDPKHTFNVDCFFSDESKQCTGNSTTSSPYNDNPDGRKPGYEDTSERVEDQTRPDHWKIG